VEPGSSPRESVTALGRLEPYGGVIDISAPPGDRVARVEVKEGKQVKQGTPLVTLESLEFRKKEEQLAQTQLDEARERLKAINISINAQIKEAEIKYRQLHDSMKADFELLQQKEALQEKQLKYANDNYASVKDLGPGTVSTQEKEKLHLAATAAQSDLDATRQMMDKAKNALNQSKAEEKAQMASLGASRTRAELEVPLKTAEQNLKLAQERTKQSIVTAPSDGVVLVVLTHKGEVTGTRPLLQLGDTRQLAVIAEVDESDILYVSKCNEASVTSTTLEQLAALFGGSKNLPGEVDQIGRTFGANQLRELNPAARTSRRVVEVKIKLHLEPGKAREAVERLINHQVKVTIKPGTTVKGCK
jgi:HlyD family secretion protein